MQTIPFCLDFLIEKNQVIVLDISPTYLSMRHFLEGNKLYFSAPLFHWKIMLEHSYQTKDSGSSCPRIVNLGPRPLQVDCRKKKGGAEEIGRKHSRNQHSWKELAKKCCR